MRQLLTWIAIAAHFALLLIILSILCQLMEAVGWLTFYTISWQGGQ